MSQLHFHHHSDKSSLYSNSLDSVKRLNLFNKPFPLDLHGKVISDNGNNSTVGMDWKEILRKFNKHVKGKELTSQTSLTEHILHTYLFKSSQSSHFHPSTSYTTSDSPAFIFPPPVLNVDIPSSLASLKELESALSTRGKSSEKGGEVEVESASITLAWGYYSIGDSAKCLSILEEGGEGGVENLEGISNCEGYDLVLRVLKSTLIGWSKAQLGSSPLELIQYYTNTKSIYQKVCSILTSKGEGTVKTDVTLHLIGEDILFRLCLLSSNSSDPAASQSHHSAYLSLPLPSTAKSLLIHNSYRSLLLQSLSSTSTNPNLSHIRNEFKRLNHLQELVVRNLTSLPRAGEINSLYLEFLDGVMLVWKVGGEKKEDCEELIEIMYRALTHTFQSQRLLRYLIHLLTIQATSGSYITAGKTIKLYVELWNNSRLTDAKKVVRDIRKFRMNTTGKNTIGESNSIKAIEEDKIEKRQSKDLKSSAGIPGEEEDFDIDSEENFISTVIFGSRVFIKFLEEPVIGLELARRGKDIFEEGKKEGKFVGCKVLESRIESALGVALGALTEFEANSETRFTNQSLSISHLERSISLHPTSSSTLYQLSYALAESRQIESALKIAMKVVELSPGCIEGWHLLGLLVAAQMDKKDLGASLQVLETALDDDEFGDEDEEETEGEVQEPRECKKLVVLEGAGGYDYRRSGIEILEAEVGIRMTKNVVIEAMEGPDAALMDQAGLLAYFSKGFETLKEVMVAEPSKVSNATLEVPSNNGNQHGKSSSSISRKLSLRRGLAESTRSRNVSTTSGLSNIPSPSESLISLDESPPAVESDSRATTLLVKLWLMSAASFRRASKLDECRGAIQEAERLNGDDPDIWVQFALYWIANGDLEQARTSIQKSLSFSIEHIPAIIIQARLYLTSIPSKVPFAEGMLTTLTRTHGWNVPEAWFELSTCYKEGGRKERERECLVEALKLENSRSVREFSVVPRVL